MPNPILPAVVAGLLLAVPAGAVPPEVARQLPPDHRVLAEAKMRVGTPAREVVVVAIGRTEEGDWRREDRAPVRPLLLFARKPGGGFVPIGRNDTVVDRADEGGQCDPFTDTGGVIAVRGAFFTVQNQVACGQHWSDYITFRFDPGLASGRGGFVFDNEQSEAWTLNPSQDPGAEALVRAGPHQVRRSPAGRVVRFEDWRPSP